MKANREALMPYSSNALLLLLLLLLVLHNL
jgi:hypothetical protein